MFDKIVRDNNSYRIITVQLDNVQQNLVDHRGMLRLGRPLQSHQIVPSNVQSSQAIDIRQGLQNWLDINFAKEIRRQPLPAFLPRNCCRES